MTKKPTEKHPRVTVTRQYGKDGDEETTDVELEVRRFEVEPAHVTAEYSMTINLGNFESARCNCSVTLPCYIEEIEPAFEKAWKIAKAQLQEQTKGIKQKRIKG